MSNELPPIHWPDDGSDPRPSMAEQVARNLRKHRAAKRLTRNTVARRAGIPWLSYREYEAARRTPTLETLAKIAVALDVALSKLAWRPPLPPAKRRPRSHRPKLPGRAGRPRKKTPPIS